MNGGMIRFILGSVLKVESVLLLFPCIVAVFYRESAGYWFLLTAVLSFVIGYLMVRKKPANTDYDQSGRLSAILFVRRDSCIYRRVI